MMNNSHPYYHVGEKLPLELVHILHPSKAFRVIILPEDSLAPSLSKVHNTLILLLQSWLIAK
jgi:hypothetical protein